MVRKVLGLRSIRIVKTEGAACSAPSPGSLAGSLRYLKLSNKEVCMKLRVPSILTTLRVHRLQFLQSMLKDKDNHKLYLATLFNKYVHLPEEGAACSAPPDIVDSGENDVDCSLQVFSKQGDSITKGHRSDGTLRSCSIIQQDVLPTTENRIERTNTVGKLFCRQRKVLPTTGNRNEEQKQAIVHFCSSKIFGHW